MTATLMAGGPLAERIRAQVAEDVQELGGIGLATVQVGEDPSSTVYIRRKHEAAGEAVIGSTDLKLPADISQEALVAAVEELNADDEIDGILVQLPLPGQLDEAQAVLAIDPVKDVDGVHPFNAGQLYLGRPTLVPATPLGIMALLEDYRIGLDGARAVVIGRSDIVGKPVAIMLMQRGYDATVTVCHSRTANLPEIARQADILIVAIGRPKFVTADMVKPGAAVIDVGINRTETGLVGDVDFAAVKEIAGHITPVPGGVGPMTRTMLLYNTLLAAREQQE
jgi:methylenetetrahydrofolate dehydrogenase (NADP+)/methenyltetrahydrofolate cyclohydrolase